MLRLAPFPADTDHVLPLELDGAVGKQDFSNIVSEIDDRLTRHDKLRLYIEIHSLGDQSPKAAFDDLKNALRHWDRFEKKAIVSDIESLTKAAEWGDKIAPKSEMRGFAMKEREAAQQWVRS